MNTNYIEPLPTNAIVSNANTNLGKRKKTQIAANLPIDYTFIRICSNLNFSRMFEFAILFSEKKCVFIFSSAFYKCSIPIKNQLKRLAKVVIYFEFTRSFIRSFLMPNAIWSSEYGKFDTDFAAIWCQFVIKQFEKCHQSSKHGSFVCVHGSFVALFTRIYA